MSERGFWQLESLADAELEQGLRDLVARGRAVDARVVAHLAEVEARRLHLYAGASSLFIYCQKYLNLSESQAFHRITAARVAGRFPAIFGMLERGELHLSSVALLSKHLTSANHWQLLEQARGKTKLALLEMLARHAPRPGVVSTIRRLPTAVAFGPTGSLEPLSPNSYRLELSLNPRLKDKLSLARDLMSHSNPSGDLAVVVERGIDLLLQKLQSQRLGQSSAAAARSQQVSNAAQQVPNAAPSQQVPGVAQRASAAALAQQVAGATPTQQAWSAVAAQSTPTGAPAHRKVRTTPNHRAPAAAAAQRATVVAGFHHAPNVGSAEQASGVAPPQQASGVAPPQQARGVAPPQQASGVAPPQQARGVAPPHRAPDVTSAERSSGVPSARQVPDVAADQQLSDVASDLQAPDFASDRQLSGVASGLQAPGVALPDAAPTTAAPVVPQAPNLAQSEWLQAKTVDSLRHAESGVPPERPNEAPRKRRPISRGTVRKLVERDGDCCSFVSWDGKRCETRAFLQVHHEQAWAKGGGDSIENLRLLCAAHNRLLGALEFGGRRRAS